VGDAPYFSISSDGTHVWVANGNDTVTELDASTGAVVQTIDGVNGPDGVSSDGTDVWVANEGVNSEGDNTVTEIDASTGAVVQTITVGEAPSGVSSDGTHVWVTNGYSTVTELNASTGAVVQNIAVGAGAYGVSSDGTDAWVTNYEDNTVSEIDASTGTVVQTITVGGSPIGISSDGTHVWVENEGDNTVSEIAIAGTPGFTITTSSLPACTTGVAYGPVALQEAGAGTSTSPYTTTLKWKKVTLPKGMTLSSAGVLSGTPSSKLVGGSSSITVQVTETVTTLNGRRKVKTTTTVQATIPLTIIQPPPAVTSVHKTSGPSAGGTTVSIKGTSLQGASVVTFGSVDATSFTVNSAGTAITALTPAEAAGPVDVRVTDPGGTSPTSSADVFTFTP
jgi:YVTN family beta-propeller protein